MRKIASSGKTDRATRLSLRAEARSRPNGFSTMTRARRPGPRRRALDHGREERGRNGQVVRRAPGIAQRLLERRERVPGRCSRRSRTEQGEQMVARRAGRRSRPSLGCCPSTRLRSCARLHFGKATPTTGTSGRPASPSRRAPGRSSCGRDRPSRRTAPARPNGRAVIRRLPSWRRPSLRDRRTRTAGRTAPCRRSRPRRAS